MKTQQIEFGKNKIASKSLTFSGLRENVSFWGKKIENETRNNRDESEMNVMNGQGHRVLV
jgi:hypothetical protein